jgi:hypothetical protein
MRAPALPSDLKFGEGVWFPPMTEHSAGNDAPQLRKPQDSGWIWLTPTQNAGKGWNFIPLAPGIFGSFFAYSLYPLLDGRYVVMGIVFLFLILAGLVPRAAVLSGVALALFAAALSLNGALDKFPPAEVKTTVVRKASVTGSQKHGTHYHVIVSSWRPGRTEEQLDVDSSVYRRAVVGRVATVELHKGYFGIPWLGNISPQ